MCASPPRIHGGFCLSPAGQHIRHLFRSPTPRPCQRSPIEPAHFGSAPRLLQFCVTMVTQNCSLAGLNRRVCRAGRWRATGSTNRHAAGRGGAAAGFARDGKPFRYGITKACRCSLRPASAPARDRRARSARARRACRPSSCRRPCRRRAAGPAAAPRCGFRRSP